MFMQFTDSLQEGNTDTYYMEESILLGTKPLEIPYATSSGTRVAYFSVCHLFECHIVQWHHDSRLLLLLKCFLHIIKRTLHIGSKIWILCSCHRVISSISVHTCLSPSTCQCTNCVFIGASLLVACRWYICCMIQVWQAPDKVEISTLTLDLALNNKHIVLPSLINWNHCFTQAM